MARSSVVQGKVNKVKWEACEEKKTHELIEMKIFVSPYIIIHIHTYIFIDQKL